MITQQLPPPSIQYTGLDVILLEADLRISHCDEVTVLLSPYPNEFLSRKNNSIVKDALFDFTLKSNKQL